MEISSVEEELVAVEVIDQDPKVKALKDTLDFPSIDFFFEFRFLQLVGE